MINAQMETPRTAPSSESRSLPEAQLSLGNWQRELEEFINTYPAAFLAISLGAGFLFGWWVKKR